MDHDGGAGDVGPAETVATWPAGGFAEDLAVGADGAPSTAPHPARLVRVAVDTTAPEP